MNETKAKDTSPSDCLDPDRLKNIGLRGVVVADSKICKVDSANGRLVYRGFDILDLAKTTTYEEIVHLLLMDTLPDADELKTLKSQLASYRTLPDPVAKMLKALPKNSQTMDMLQSIAAALACFDEDLEDVSRDALMKKALRLIARMPLLVSAWHRIRNDQDVIRPRDDLGHAANFLYTLFGRVPDPQTARDMDVALVLHAEHSFNASTFTARQIASTRAHVYACVSGAIGSLSGPLHGGANARVFQMLQQIGSVENVESYVNKTFDEGGLIMGLGHAVYKTIDPRAIILGPMSKRLGEAKGEPVWYELSKKLRDVGEREFEKRKGIKINPNVDFYSASVYHYMGFPVDLFTPIFAVSRVAGWIAHIVEEKFGEAGPKPTLYRPRAEYIGRYCGLEGCELAPLEERKK